MRKKRHPPTLTHMSRSRFWAKGGHRCQPIAHVPKSGLTRPIEVPKRNSFPLANEFTLKKKKKTAEMKDIQRKLDSKKRLKERKQSLRRETRPGSLAAQPPHDFDLRNR